MVIGVLIAAGFAIGLALHARARRSLVIRAPHDRPILLLLTSLPLVFGESFYLKASGSPALKALQSRYRVAPIGVSSPEELGRGKLLLMAQPRAQPAEDLVALDSWVRGGGRVLLLADPMLEWPSERPLGDLLRPAPMFVDTGLLAHWGLRLDAPDRRGPQQRRIGARTVMTASPGALEGSCRVAADAFVADCTIGQGRAIVVADADLLDADQFGPEERGNLDAVLAELAQLESK
jgi:hypothetical protein